MANDHTEHVVTNNETAQQFEIRLGDATALAAYQRRDDQIIFTHTEVPAAMEGKGIGGKLAKTALDFARANNLAVIPLCPFIAAYIRRHPEYADLVPDQYR